MVVTVLNPIFSVLYICGLSLCFTKGYDNTIPFWIACTNTEIIHCAYNGTHNKSRQETWSLCTSSIINSAACFADALIQLSKVTHHMPSVPIWKPLLQLLLQNRVACNSVATEFKAQLYSGSPVYQIASSIDCHTTCLLRMFLCQYVANGIVVPKQTEAASTVLYYVLKLLRSQVTHILFRKS